MFYVAAAACLAGLARAPDSHAQTAPNSSTGHTTEQDQLEEVVVTAERRAEDIQKVAASVSVRTGQELQEQGRYELSDILQDVAGVVGGAANGLAGGASSGTDQI
ncbi:MAG: outer membrane salicin receptor, partial [Steroidobacteraceae bacterium]